MLFQPEAFEEYLLSLEVIRDGSGHTLEKTVRTVRTVRMAELDFVDRSEEFVAMSEAEARKFTTFGEFWGRFAKLACSQSRLSKLLVLTADLLLHL